MPLTAHQEEKWLELKSWIDKGHKRINIIGAAGVGKTFFGGEIIRRLSRYLFPHYNNGYIYVTAPTNKALAVIRSKVSSPVEFSTIHSALKLRRHIDGRTGRVSFVKGWSANDYFKNAKFAIIDESSMLNTEIEGGMIMNPHTHQEEYYKGHLDSYGFPIIYIGDSHQINPIGEPISPIYRKNYPTIELTEIIRQGSGNPIIDLSRDIDMIFFKTPSLNDGKGYVYNDNKSQLIDMLAEANGTDEMKYLAFTNQTVDEINTTVRKKIYGENPNKIEIGETIVMDAPYGEQYTNKEVKVEILEIHTRDVIVPKQDSKFDHEGIYGPTDKIKMKYYVINGVIKVVHEDSEFVYKELISQLKYNCSKLAWNWKAKFFFEELFASIKYNHAITIHKSQGSTYKSTIMNVGDIMINKNAEERQRLMYTAITRASDVLILNNVK